MIVVCPSCGAKNRLSDAFHAGRTYHCGSCKTAIDPPSVTREEQANGLRKISTLSLSLILIWGETVGIVHAFRQHGTTAGLLAVLVPPFAWWRGLEFFYHEQRLSARASPTTEETPSAVSAARSTANTVAGELPLGLVVGQSESTPVTRKTVCSAFSMYLSDGASETQVQTPERFNHGWDDVFKPMGYTLVPCSKAQIKLHIKMHRVQPPAGAGKVIIDIVGSGNARSDKYRTTASISELTANEEEFLNRCGFGIMKVMETLEPGFMAKFHRVFDRK